MEYLPISRLSSVSQGAHCCVHWQLMRPDAVQVLLKEAPRGPVKKEATWLVCRMRCQMPALHPHAGNIALHSLGHCAKRLDVKDDLDEEDEDKACNRHAVRFTRPVLHADSHVFLPSIRCRMSRRRMLTRQKRQLLHFGQAFRGEARYVQLRPAKRKRKLRRHRETVACSP